MPCVASALLRSHTEEGMETRMVRQEEIVDMKRMVKERIDEFVRCVLVCLH